MFSKINKLLVSLTKRNENLLAAEMKEAMLPSTPQIRMWKYDYSDPSVSW